MFKRVICLALVISMLSTSVVFASHDILENNSQLRNGIDSLLGYFKIVENGVFKYAGNQEKIVDSEDYFTAYTIDDGYIFNMGDNNYLVQAEEDIYVLCKKILVDHTNLDKSFKELSLNYDIPQDVEDDIRKVVSSKNGDFEEGFSVNIYLPSEKVESELFATTSDPGAGDSTCSYNYNGYSMKMVVTVYNNHSTGMVDYASGSNVRTIIGTVVSLVNVALSSHLPLFTGGISILQALISSGHPAPSGNSGDRAAFGYVYNMYVKNTYVLDGGSWIGNVRTLSAQSIRTDHRIFDGSTGETQMFSSPMSGRFYSTLYRAPSNESIVLIENAPNETYDDFYILVKLYNTYISLH